MPVCQLPETGRGLSLLAASAGAFAALAAADGACAATGARSPLPVPRRIHEQHGHAAPVGEARNGQPCADKQRSKIEGPMDKEAQEFYF